MQHPSAFRLSRVLSSLVAGWVLLWVGTGRVQAGQPGTQNQCKIPAYLARVIKHTDLYERRNVVCYLSRMSPDQFGWMRKCALSASWEHRHLAIHMLTYYMPFEQRKTLALLLSLANSPDWRTGVIATRGLALRFPGKKKVRSLILRLLRHKDWRIRQTALWSAYRLTPQLPGVHAVFRKARRDRSYPVRLLARFLERQKRRPTTKPIPVATAIQQVQMKRSSAALLSALYHITHSILHTPLDKDHKLNRLQERGLQLAGTDKLFWRFLGGWSKIQRDACGAAPYGKHVSLYDAGTVRANYINSVSLLLRMIERFRPTLRSFVHGGSVVQQQRACWLLLLLGQKARPMVPLLLKTVRALRQKAATTRMISLEMLRASILLSSKKPSLPSLQTLVSHRQPAIVHAAILRLGELRAYASTSVPLLVGLLKQKRPFWHKRAIYLSLQRLASDSKAARKKLFLTSVQHLGDTTLWMKLAWDGLVRLSPQKRMNIYQLLSQKQLQSLPVRKAILKLWGTLPTLSSGQLQVVAKWLRNRALRSQLLAFLQRPHQTPVSAQMKRVFGPWLMAQFKLFEKRDSTDLPAVTRLLVSWRWKPKVFRKNLLIYVEDVLAEDGSRQEAGQLMVHAKQWLVPYARSLEYVPMVAGIASVLQAAFGKKRARTLLLKAFAKVDYGKFFGAPSGSPIPQTNAMLSQFLALYDAGQMQMILAKMSPGLTWGHFLRYRGKLAAVVQKALLGFLGGGSRSDYGVMRVVLRRLRISLTVPNTSVRKKVMSYVGLIRLSSFQRMWRDRSRIPLPLGMRTSIGENKSGLASCPNCRWKQHIDYLAFVDELMKWRVVRRKLRTLLR